MFEQDRLMENERSRGVFRGDSGPGMGMSRYQVSGTGDSAEIAADRAADQAVGGGLFRSAEGVGGSGFQADLADSDLGGGGSPLPEGLMGSMEQSLGGSFSGVRVHTDAGADRASRSIDARAFTRGQDIYFSQGSYAPDTPEGQHLIAHELAHVAAGDTGIHRAENGGGSGGSGGGSGSGTGGGTAGGTSSNAPAQQQPSEDERKFSEAIEQLKDDGGGLVKSANNIVTEFQEKKATWGSLQSAAKEVKEAGSSSAAAGKVSTINQFITTVKTMTNANEKSSLLSKLNSFIEQAALAAGKLGYGNNDPGMDVLTSAKTARDALKLLPDDLGSIEGPVAFAQEEAAAMDSGKEFSEPVTEMMNHSACDAFFMAVEKVRKGSGGDMGAMGSTMKNLRTNNADVKGHMSKNVGNTAAEKLGRGTAAFGVALGYAGAGASALELGSGFDEEIKGEKNVNEDSQRTGTAASHSAAIVDTLGAANDWLAAGAESHVLRKQEEKRRDRRKEMETMYGKEAASKIHTSDHKQRSAVAADWIRTGGSTVGAANSIFATTTGKGSDEKNRVEETKGTAMSLTSDSASVLGDVMGLGIDSAKVDEQRKQDRVAKDGLRKIGAQLAKLVQGSTNPVDLQIKSICDFVGNESQKKFRGLKGKIDTAINALGGNPQQGNQGQAGQGQANQGQAGQNQAGQNQANQGQAAPAVEKAEEKKKFLKMMQALESSRSISKSAASDSKKDVIFDLISLSGSLTSLASSITSMAGAGMAGLILNTVASAIGLFGTIKDTPDAIGDLSKDAQTDRNKERDKKVNACTAAVEQMAALPELKLEELRAARSNKLPLNEAKMESAEQYAAVFSIVKAANVNMVDFLYAVGQGGFDAQNGTLDEKTKKMLMNLEFTN